MAEKKREYSREENISYKQILIDNILEGQKTKQYTRADLEKYRVKALEKIHDQVIRISVTTDY